MQRALDQPHIPRPATSLVGREGDLARLNALLRQPDARMVTLTGPGGVGKTRLALQFAQEAAGGALGDVFFVPLAQASSEEAIWQALARAVDLHPESAIPLETHLREWIGDRRMLLILDNAEQVVEQLALHARLLDACPHLKVLITSRVPLRLSGEHLFPVPPLPSDGDAARPSPAATLFIERARSVQPDLDLSPESQAAIEAICRELDGLPLAIELAAARARFLSPMTLRERLGDRLQLLVGGPRDAPARHQTLRAALAWSHDLLDPLERAVFRRLAVFENGGPYDAAIAVCAGGDAPDMVEHALDALADQNLTVITDTPATGPRVRLLHTIREFALERLTESGERDDIALAHARWFAGLVIGTDRKTWSTGSARRRAWVFRHEPDLENFNTALQTLVDAHEEVTAVRALGGLITFWEELGYRRLADAWVRRLMPWIEQAPEGEQAFLYFMAAASTVNVHAVEEAMPAAVKALELAERLGDTKFIANCQNALGELHWLVGQPAAGERLQRAAIATTQAQGDAFGSALFATALADHLIETGALDEAGTLLADALPLFERERPDALALAAGSAAYLALLRGNLDEAGREIERSLAYHRDPPHRLPQMLAAGLVHAGELAAKRGDAAAGARLVGAARAISQRWELSFTELLEADTRRTERALRDQLGDDAWRTAFAAGERLSMPDAIDLAIGVAHPRAATRASTAAPAGDLTPREREVLALLVAGKSNPAIAEALSISERTVTTHLSRLYAKLDVATRTEAVAEATRRGFMTASTHT